MRIAWIFLSVTNLFLFFIKKKVIYRLEIKNNCVSLHSHRNDADIFARLPCKSPPQVKEQNAYRWSHPHRGVGFSILYAGLW